MKRIKL